MLPLLPLSPQLLVQEECLRQQQQDTVGQQAPGPLLLQGVGVEAAVTLTLCTCPLHEVWQLLGMAALASMASQQQLAIPKLCGRWTGVRAALPYSLQEVSCSRVGQLLVMLHLSALQASSRGNSDLHRSQGCHPSTQVVLHLAHCSSRRSHSSISITWCRCCLVLSPSSNNCSSNRCYLPQSAGHKWGCCLPFLRRC